MEDLNEFSDVSLDLSTDAELADDSGIEACYYGPQNSHLINELSSDDNSIIEEVDDELLTLEGDGYQADGEQWPLKPLQPTLPSIRNYFNSKDYRMAIQRVNKPYKPIATDEIEFRIPHSMTIKEDSDEDSILEVELTASGEEDDSVLELVIPMHKNYQHSSIKFSLSKLLTNFFCCK